MRIRKAETEVNKNDNTINKTKVKMKRKAHKIDEEQEVESATSIRKINNRL